MNSPEVWINPATGLPASSEDGGTWTVEGRRRLHEARCFARLLRRAGTRAVDASVRLLVRFDLAPYELRSVLQAVWRQAWRSQRAVAVLETADR